MSKTTPNPPKPVTSAGAEGDTFGQRIKVAREAVGLSQQAVATRSKWVDPEGKGISRTALIGYESESSRPGARELRIICETLTVSPNKLLFGLEHPFQTSHPALERLTADSGAEFRQAVETAVILSALKGHERDALMSLALSLAGRQLGDVRLGGLRMLAGMLTPEIWSATFKDPSAGAEPSSSRLEDIALQLSRHQGSTFGNRLRMNDEGEVDGGVVLYPDPERKDKKS